MPRCKKHRCCRGLGDEIIYKPIAVPLAALDVVRIQLDEFEAMRLCDVEGLDQKDAGTRMAVSRGTIQRLLAAGRHKMIEAILCNAAIKIEQSDIGETNEDMHSHGG